MRTEVDEVLARTGGVASRSALLRVLTRNEFDHEVRSGHLVAPFPRTYCRPWDQDHPPIRERAALVSVGQPAAISHLTAQRRWGLTTPGSEQLHVTTPIGRHPIGRAPGLTVHRTRVPTRVRMVAGLPTVEPAIAVVRSWPLLQVADQRAPAIEAVRTGLVQAAELRAAAERAVGMPGRSRLLRLTGLLAAGCQSELEIWGHLGVFSIPGLDHGARQKVIRAGDASYRLDIAYDQERVAVELDGERYHGTREQRERDRRRDAALASIDWVTLRFSHARLHGDVAGCRRDTLRTLAARRHRFAA
jgi:very-short-patch-repair endonuclease